MGDWRLEFRPLDPLFGPRAPGEGYLILTDGERECRPCESFRENYPDDLAEGERENFQRMSDDLNAGRWTWDKTYANRVIYAPDGRGVPLDEVAERLTLLDAFFQERRNIVAGRSYSSNDNHPVNQAIARGWL